MRSVPFKFLQRALQSRVFMLNCLLDNIYSKQKDKLKWVTT